MSVISCISSAHISLLYVIQSCSVLLILIETFILRNLSCFSQCFPIVPLGGGIGRTPCLLLCSCLWRGRYYCKQDFGPPCKIMESKDQQCLGLFLLELETHREKILNNNRTTTAHQHRTITAFFSSITHATNQSMATQIESWPTQLKGVTKDGAITMWHASKQRLFEPWPSSPLSLNK